jgi:hypothetical protein
VTPAAVTQHRRARRSSRWGVRGALLVIAGAIAGVLLLLMPPRAHPRAAAAFALSWPVVRGAFHVHSVRSDGTGSIDEIAAAASRAGLQFVILTDHGNGTRAPEPPSYRSGVLCLDGVEISTNGGHYIAIDLPQTPYPLAGDPRDVIEDVRRFGGFGIAAHPGSPKPELQWNDWDAAFDGVEWLNADSEWRDEFLGSLGAVLVTYAFRPVETLGGLLDRPDRVLAAWDRVVAHRRVVGLAGADAHARLGFGNAPDPYEDRVIARLPSYEVSFRAFSNHVILDGRFTGDATVDAALLLSALRNGRVFTVVESLAELSAFEAKATSGTAVARIGETLDVPTPVAIEASVAAPSGVTLSVWRDGKAIYEIEGAALRVDVGRTPGAYRVEARLPARRNAGQVPWIVSNPIYVGRRDGPVFLATTADAAGTPPLRSAVATWLWRAEASAASSSALEQTPLEDGTPALVWRFAIASSLSHAPYAAIRFPMNAEMRAHTGIQLRARSDKPRRLWAQLRAPGGGEGERWGRTFYLDPELRVIDLQFSQFRPIGPAASARPPLDRVDSLLLVVDTVNHEPGAAGRIALTDLWLTRSP